jgi:hypothetical protein
MGIINQYPSNQAKKIELNPIIWIRFNTELAVSTISDKSVVLFEVLREIEVKKVVSYDHNTKEIIIRLYGPLKSGTEYGVIIGTDVYTASPYKSFSNAGYLFTFYTGLEVNANNPYVASTEFSINSTGSQNDTSQQTTTTTTQIPVQPTNQTEEEPTITEDIVINPPPTVPDIDVNLTDFALVGCYPLHNSTDTKPKQVIFTFNENVESVDSISILTEDILGEYCDKENNLDNYIIEVQGNKVILTTTAALYNQFRYSTIYNITLYGVKDIEGEILHAVRLEFTTRLAPLYSTVKIIRLSLGPIVKDLTDEEINMLIYLHSIYVYQSIPVYFRMFMPSQVVREYVTCAVKKDLLERYNYFSAAESGSSGDRYIKKKQLADFTIEWGIDGGKAMEKLSTQVDKCLERTALALALPAYMLSDGGMAITVKSWNDPRKPIAPRMGSWNRLGDKGDNFSHNYGHFYDHYTNLFNKDFLNYRRAIILSNEQKIENRVIGYDIVEV